MKSLAGICGKRNKMIDDSKKRCTFASPKNREATVLCHCYPQIQMGHRAPSGLPKNRVGSSIVHCYPLAVKHFGAAVKHFGMDCQVDQYVSLNFDKYYSLTRQNLTSDFRKRHLTEQYAYIIYMILVYHIYDACISLT